MASAAHLATALGAQRQGHNWRCDCPLGCGYALSLADGESGLLVKCFGGHDFNEIMDVLVQYGLLDDDNYSVAPTLRDSDPHKLARERAIKIAHACKVYESTRPDERVLVYLRSRAIELTSPVLRFSEQAPHRLGIRLPAMLAPIVNVNGEQIGTHLTYLRVDGTGKADLPKEFQRETRGAIRGGVIRLSPHDPSCELVIGEGLESALAASQIFVLPAWAAIYADNLKSTLALPATARRILIAADNDISGTGEHAAAEAQRRWIGEARAVRRLLPKAPGEDFNALLIRKSR